MASSGRFPVDQAIIDIGTEWYENTEHADRGILYLGMGISGGEEAPASRSVQQLAELSIAAPTIAALLDCRFLNRHNFKPSFQVMAIFKTDSGIQNH
ncbi:hypothetical protein MRB53_014534 [Persea americana]|uniref:Uncharacterized protein n=1 Tax=Persea americana TaxID=3435 RepID=A0ACC2KBA2_PERAE|nr:hypothetical protein MRB53_014534 [Persea americana]